jgi:hypothetical protein
VHSNFIQPTPSTLKESHNYYFSILVIYILLNFAVSNSDSVALNGGINK